MRQGETLRGEEIHRRKDGSSIPVMYVTRAFFDPEGKLAGYVAVYRDLSNEVQEGMGGSSGEDHDAKSALRESEEKYRRIVETANEGIWEIDRDTRTTFVNHRMAEMLGYSVDELIGRSSFEFVFPEDVVHGERRLERAKVGVASTASEFRFRRKDGSVLWALVTTSPQLDEQGEFLGSIAMMVDIRERKQLEQRLEQNNRRLNEILESIQDDFYVLDRDWNFVFASRLFTSKVGKEPGDFIGKNIWEMFPKHLGTAFEVSLRAAMENREIQRFEILGKYTNAWYRMTAFPSEEGVTVLGSDITERKRAEESLRENERKFFLLFEKAGFAAALSELPDGTLVDVNEEWVKQFGYTRQEAAGKTTLQLNINPDAEGRARILAQVREKGAAHNIEIRLCTKSGEWRSYLTNVDLIDIGEKKYMFNTLQDITERRRAEAEHQKAERRYHLVGELIPFGVWETDVEGNATYLSPLYLEMTGQTLEEHRQSWQSLIHADEVDSLVEAWRECVRRGGMWDQEFRVRGKDGNYYAIHARGLPLYNPAGELASYVGINFDVTEHQRVEQALRESEKELQLLNESLEQKVHEKTAEVRRLASDMVRAVQSERHRISHILHDDLQQRIYAIQMQLAFLHHQFQEVNEAAQKEVYYIGKQLEEILEITRNLSIDLSPPILQDEGLSQAINWLAGRMRERYGLPIEIQADGPFIIPDEELQIFLFNCVRELLFNVVKHAEAGQAVVRLQWSDGGLQIEVRDDGKGFPSMMGEQQVASEMSGADDLQLSFGLPTIRQQLGLFGGRMEIKSEPRAGTQITLIIPVVQDR